MPNTARVNITEVDQSNIVGDVAKNISGLIIDAERGPINDPSILITSANQFQKIFGGVRTGGTSNIQSVNVALRALAAGSALRVVNVKNAAIAAAPTATNRFRLSAALVAGSSLKITLGNDNVGKIDLITPFITSSKNTLDVALNNLLNTWYASMYAQANILIARSLNGTDFVIVTDNSNNLITPTVVNQVGVTISTVTATAFVNSTGDPIFGLAPKYAGAKYNDIVAEVLAPSSGRYGEFDLHVTLLNSELDTEVYKNLSVDWSDLTGWLKEVADTSQIVKPVYQSLVALTGPAFPVPNLIKFSGGSDGSVLATTDIIGVSTAKTGIYALDGYQDIYRFGIAPIGALNYVTGGIHQAGADYARNRQDLSYFGELIGSKDASTIVAQMQSMAIDTSYARFYSPGNGIILADGSIRSALGDVLGLAAKSANDYGPWYSYANSNRGALSNVLGVDNLWGASGNDTDLNYLANNRINAVTLVGKSIAIWGNFTAQVKSSALSYASIRDLFIFIKKSLKPTLLPFIEEPNDFTTWLSIYHVVRPFFKNLEDKRAIQKEPAGWKWDGDQYVGKMEDLVVNNAADVMAGKYRVNLYVTPINSLQEFTVAINITSSSVSFEENLNN